MNPRPVEIMITRATEKCTGSKISEKTSPVNFKYLYARGAVHIQDSTPNKSVPSREILVTLVTDNSLL